MINDLLTDQRVHRTCMVLVELGYEVVLVGRIRKSSPVMDPRPYKAIRMRLVFDKGPLFYAEYNIRLFLFLLFRRADILFSNDLDTLPANWLVHKFRRIPIIYDSHEYFTETPELIHRKWVKSTWEWIEKSIVPRLKMMITVNGSIAGEYHRKYGIRTEVVRNLPSSGTSIGAITRKELGLPENRRIVLLQGSGINIHRGAEELIMAMQYLTDVVLLIIGAGDVVPGLKKMVVSFHLEDKVKFIPRLPASLLPRYTAAADLGVTLDKDVSLNYRYCLPNKLFEYIHAGIPVLASPLPEIAAVIKEYNVGRLIESHDPEHIAGCIKSMLDDNEAMNRWRANTGKASRDLCWEEEKEKLANAIRSYA